MQLPDNHQDIVDRFLAACQADERIVAAIVGGSYAEDKADKFSDLDLFFITNPVVYLLALDDFLRNIFLIFGKIKSKFNLLIQLKIRFISN